MRLYLDEVLSEEGKRVAEGLGEQPEAPAEEVPVEEEEEMVEGGA